jgi:hypothetical protein
MKIFPITLGLILISAPWVSAQVSLEIVLDEDQFLRNEALPVKVRITNLSGQTLRLGKEEDWLTFSIESREGHVVPKLGEAPVVGEFTLDSAFAATKRADLAPYFSLSQPGRYELTATLKIPQWDLQMSSKPKTFTISVGAKIWEKVIGIPASNGSPETRKFALIQTNYKERLRLYIRVTDEAESAAFKVFQLGPAVSFSKPEEQLDKFNNLHVLFQDGAQTFNYSVIKPTGELLVRRTYGYLGTSRPVLRGDEDGLIGVAAGQRMITKNDLPPAPVAVSTNVVKAVKP